MSNSDSSKQILLSVIGVAILIIAVVGVSFAFFNYTRTGSANTIRVGKLAFNTNQTETISLTNVFPISSTQAQTDTTNTDEAVITINGDTTYPNGVEYLLTVTDVHNTVGTGANQKTVPIAITVTGSNGLGTSDANYFTNRGGNSSIYKVLSDETVENDGRITVGYIKSGATGVNGTVTVKAYLDSSTIAISDTYDESDPGTDNMGTTSEWVRTRTVLTTTEWNSLQANGVSFKIKVEANEGVWVKEQIMFNANGGAVTPKYKEIENNATVYGTLPDPVWASHNFLGWYTQATGGTRVQANTTYTRGTSATTLYAHWEEIPTIPSCPGCQFVAATDYYNYGENGTPIADITDPISYDYTEILDEEYPYFSGFIEKNGKVDRAFACGVIVDEVSSEQIPFCVEGTSDATVRDELNATNRQFLEGIFGSYDSETSDGCHFFQPSQTIYACLAPTIQEDDEVFAYVYNSGDVVVGLDGDRGYSFVYPDSRFG